MAETEFVDPLGRRIVLHDRTWFGHILAGHPELLEQRARLGEAITAPLEIRHSMSDVDVRLYHIEVRAGLYLRVVADVAAGAVKTAHFIRALHGGKVEWSR